MKLSFLVASLIILFFLVLHAGYVRGWKWAVLFTFFAGFFGLWHELNPLREDDPEYFFANAIHLGGVPVVGVIGWIEIIYLSWFLMEILFPKLMRTRYLILHAIIAGLIASLFSLCIETTGIAMEWWIWREDRQHILFPMAGWAVQILFFSSVFFGLFHSNRNSKILFLAVMIAVLPTFHPQAESYWLTKPVQGLAVLAFVLFMRFDPKTWVRSHAARS